MPIDPNNPTSAANDPACLDTAADTAGGQLGMLAALLRRVFGRYFPPWVGWMPPGSQPFDVQGVIATPAIGAGATVILSLQVPSGMDGVIRRLSHNLLGPGFVQASGDVLWGITVDNAPVKNYAAISTEFGSNGVQGAGPRDTDGILAKSGQVYRYTVTNVAYAAGGTQILATIGGYFYPSPRKTGQGYAG